MRRKGNDDEETGSQRSGTSGADSASRTSSHHSTLKYLKHDRAGAHQGEEGDLLESKKSIQDGIFSCMYTLVRQSAMNSWKFAVLKIVMEFLMFFIVAFNPTYPQWIIDEKNPAWQVIRWTVWRSPIMHLYGYHTYIVVLYVMVAAVLLAVGALVWLTLAMRRQEQSKWLRKAALFLHVLYDVMFFICYVSFFDYFIYVADCDFLGRVKKHMQFEGVMCLEMPHLLHLLVGLFTALLFLLVTALMVVASSDLNPVSRGYTASPAVYPRLKILLAKAVFVISAADLDANPRVQAVVNLLAVLLICYWNFQALPFYRNPVNIVWCGEWVGILYTVVILMVLVFGRTHDEDYYLRWTNIVLYGMFPVIAFGMALCAARVWWVMRPAKKFRDLAPGTKLAKVHKLASLDEVGMLARVMRVFDQDGVVDALASAWGETVIKAGMQAYPESARLLILYANFLLEVKRDGPASRTQLQLAARHSPSLVERYQIFCTGEASKRLKDSQDCGMDLQAYIEFRRNFRAVLRVHKEVLLLQNELWTLMLRTNLRVAEVDRALDALESSTATAHQVYKRVLERYPTNGKLLRCYGKFLEDVQHDPLAATRAYGEASRHGGGDAILSLDLSQVQGATDKPEFLTSMSIEDDAVIVINAKGQIMMVSQAVQKVFGYTKVELEGVNVSVLMPQPFCQRHDGYLERYTNGGEPHILDSVREVIGLHKERYVFPMALCVTRMSGTGEDSIFLGVARPLPPNSLNVRAWLAPNGIFMCSDQQFASLCGVLEGELVGRPLASMLADPDTVVEQLLERCREATAADFMSGTIRAELLLRHRYMDPVPVAVTVGLAGTDGQRILVLNCAVRDQDDRNILVVDPHMRIRFASCGTAALLGFPVRKLMAMRLDELLPPPYNAFHARYLKEPPSGIAPTGCRAGRVVSFLHESGGAVPVRLKITTSSVSDMALSMYVVQISKASTDELLEEKRLILTADFSGRVLSVSQPDSQLFGFRSGDLVNSSLCDAIDIFQEWRDRAGESQMQLLMLALLDKEQEMPGTSWRVRVHPPAGDSTVPNLPPIAGAKPSKGKAAELSKSACLQVELHETSTKEDAGLLVGDPLGRAESRTDLLEAADIRVTLWRRDLLTGVVELDEELVVRKATPLTGLIVGMPATAMLRKPVQKFLDMPYNTSWEKIAASHTHRKQRGGLKGDTRRGTISPVMAFIGPHPDTGTMRILVQGVQVLAPGGRSKVTVTLHPDTAFAGAHADLMKVLHLDVSTHKQQEEQQQQHQQGDQSLGAGGARQRDGAYPDQQGEQKDDGDNDVDSDGDISEAGNGRARNVDEPAGSRDLEAEGQARILSRAASKSDFVAQWVRTVTKGRNGSQREPLLHPLQEDPPVGETSEASEIPARATERLEPAAAPPAGSRPGTGTAAGGPPVKTGTLTAIPEDEDPEGPPQGEVTLAHQKTRRIMARGMSYELADEKSMAGSRQNSRALSTPPTRQTGRLAGPGEGKAAAAAAEAGDAAGGAEDKWEKGSEGGDSSADGSQAASGITSATGDTSVSELVIDTRRGRLLKALQKLLMGPLLTRPLERLRLRTYALLAFLVVCHIICYIVVTKEISNEDHEVFLVQRQALAMDRSQLITVRAMMGAFCERANVTAKVSVCANSLSYTLGKLQENIGLMEQHHQYVYLGDSKKTTIKLMPEVFSIWTTPSYEYHTYMDTSPPQVNSERAGVWQLGSRYLAAAREAQYWLPVLRDKYRLHRTFQFLVTNGLGPLFEGYAHSLDLLVDSAWKSVDQLRTTLIVLLIAEAFVVQLSCLFYEAYLVQQMEGARVIGVLAMLGLPTPVLRQLANRDVKLVIDGGEDSDGDDSDSDADEPQRKLESLGQHEDGKGGGHVREITQGDKAAAAGRAEDGKEARLRDMADGAAAGKRAKIDTGGKGGAADEAADETAAEAAVGANTMASAKVLPAAGRDIPLLPPSGRDCDDAQSEEGGATAKDDEREIGAKSTGRRSQSGEAAVRNSFFSRLFSFRRRRGLEIHGKVLIPSYTSLVKFMVPFALWNIAVVVVYVVSLLDLEGMQGPLASLNMASHIIYRYTRVRAIAFGFVSQDDQASRDLWRDMLVSELRLFQSEYDALMYGGVPITQANAVFNHPVPASTFASSSFSNEFFRSKHCFRYDKSACFKPGDEYYEVTHNGLDVMVRRMLAEMTLLSQDADEDVAYNGTRYAFMYNVGGRDLYEGLQQAAQLFVDYSISHYHLVSDINTILLLVTLGLVVLFVVFILWPYLARLKADAARQSALLSHVPPEVDVRGHVRAVAKRALGGGSKPRRQVQSSASGAVAPFS